MVDAFQLLRVLFRVFFKQHIPRSYVNNMDKTII